MAYSHYHSPKQSQSRVIPRPNRSLESTGIKYARAHTKRDISNSVLNKRYLKSIIKFTKEKSIKILLYTAPAYKTYVTELDNAQLQEVVSLGEKLAREHTHVKYVNFMNDSVFSENHYFDANHLNKDGAIKFTKMILNNPYKKNVLVLLPTQSILKRK